MAVPPGFAVYEEHDGYKILINDKNQKAVSIDEDQFETMIEGKSYRIIYHKETGKRYIRTQKTFGEITEVTETSKNKPVIKFRSIPDNYVGMMVNNTLLINPNKKV